MYELKQRESRESRRWLIVKSPQIEALHSQETSQDRQIQDIDKVVYRSRGFYEETLTDLYWQYTHLLFHTKHIYIHTCTGGGGQNAKDVCKKLFVKPS